MAGRWDEARRDVAAALPGWITARLVVLVALGLAHLVAQRIDPGLEPLVHRRLHQGLLAWDGDWYLRIADRGYAALPEESLRFFPLYPMLGRVLSPVFLGNAGVALLVLANLPGPAAGGPRPPAEPAGDGRRRPGPAGGVARRPGAAVLRDGHGLRRARHPVPVGGRRSWPCAGSGGSGRRRRPSSPAWPGRWASCWPSRPPSRRRGGCGRRASASGCAGSCRWWRRWSGPARSWCGSGSGFDDPLLPLRVQNRGYLRGGWANPLATVVESVGDLVGGEVGRNAIHLPWIVVITALVVVSFRRWPASYGAFAAASLILAVSARNLGSFERYGFGAFPVVLALASITTTDWSERMAIGLSVALMTGYATWRSSTSTCHEGAHVRSASAGRSGHQGVQVRRSDPMGPRQVQLHQAPLRELASDPWKTTRNRPLRRCSTNGWPRSARTRSSASCATPSRPSRTAGSLATVTQPPFCSTGTAGGAGRRDLAGDHERCCVVRH